MHVKNDFAYDFSESSRTHRCHACVILGGEDDVDGMPGPGELLDVRPEQPPQRLRKVLRQPPFTH